MQKPYDHQTRILNCVNPNVAMYLGLKMIAQYETLNKGLHWTDVGQPPTPDEELTMLQLVLMLVFDAILIMVLTWYVEAINPTGEGVSQKPWFFVLPSYWFPDRFSKKTDLGADDTSFIGKAENNIERDSVENSTIRIVNLTKVYGTNILKQLISCNFGKGQKKVAVDGLNMNMQEGQITALIGHNGAGKSTTFSMLIGVTSPSSGTAYIEDYDIRTALPAIRKRLGFCPQYNILVNKMTVIEHLEFFCKLKGRTWDPSEAMNLLSSLQLDVKQDARAGTLSGGQQRKLSLCIALIGGSEIVMLDEPTSGMDPGARHQAWTLLQKEKMNRTMLLTTHYMEEADLLGDKIAIICKGKLECFGSGMFLKKKYGAGYHLIAVYQGEDLREISHKTCNFLSQYCSSITIESIAGNEVNFLLPEDQRPNFSNMFEQLEANQAALGISGFGLSVTSMEEVFLKVNDLAEENDSSGDKISLSSSTNQESAIQRLYEFRTESKNRGATLYMQHFKAMIYKRLLYYKRRWTVFIPQIIIPVIYVALFVWTTTTFPKTKEQDPLRIDLSAYESKGLPAHVFFGGENLFPDIGSEINKTAFQWTKNLDLNIESIKGPEAILIDSIVNTMKEKGTTTFGLHNPSALTAEKLSYGNKSLPINAVVGLFNNFALHSPPLSLALADNLLIREMIKKPMLITVTNHPLPPTVADSLKKGQFSQTAGMFIGYAIITAVSLIVSGYASLLIRERKKRFKHLQIMVGLKMWIYWLSAFVWDFIFYVLPAAFILLTFVIFDIHMYTERSIPILGIILLLFGWNVIPLVYSLQFIFSSAPKGYAFITIGLIITGMIGAIAVPIITSTSGDDVSYTVEVILSMYFPTYNVANCFQKIYNNEYARISCKSINCDIEIFKKNAPQCCGSGSEIVYAENILLTADKRGLFFGVLFFIIEGFLYWALTIILENGYIGKAINKLKRSSQRRRNDKINEAFVWSEEHVDSHEDSDVIAERDAVAQMSPDQYPIIVKNLCKNYGLFEAVKNLNFHVNMRDCFGLLGVNGAGKTSTFKMLIGENTVTKGDAFIHGFSVTENWRNACTNIGYCPQYDAIMKELTGEETLYLIARIRGIPEQAIPDIVNTIIDIIDIRQHAFKQIKAYSGGNKRRLSLGMSLVGSPPVLMLDEPSSGVDPKARRLIWDILAQLRSLGTAIVLTSHSMEECEALCTNLAIMVDGQFKCFGSCQHIKNKFGSGYTLLVRTEHENSVQQIKQAIMNRFPGSILKEEHVLQLNFELKRTDKQKWSQLFDGMEKLSCELPIADYSLSQTTLEQVFLEFSRQVKPDQLLPTKSHINGFSEVRL